VKSEIDSGRRIVVFVDAPAGVRSCLTAHYLGEGKATGDNRRIHIGSGHTPSTCTNSKYISCHICVCACVRASKCAVSENFLLELSNVSPNLFVHMIVGKGTPVTVHERVALLFSVTSL